MYEAISATGVKTVVKFRFRKKNPKKQQLVKSVLKKIKRRGQPRELSLNKVHHQLN